MEFSSPALQLVLLLALIPLLCLHYLRLRRNAKLPPRANGLRVYPLLGTLPHFLKNQHRFLEWTAGVMKRDPAHTMSVKALGLTGAAITANPANVEHILKTNFANYPKGELAVSMIEDFLGHGIFNSNGEQWLWQRKAASYEFSKRSLRKFIVETVRSEVDERLLPLLEEAAAGRRALDMQHVLESFAFDNICHVTFGDDPGCLAKDGRAAPQAVEFARAYDYVENAVLLRFRPPEIFLWRIKRMLNVQVTKRQGPEDSLG